MVSLRLGCMRLGVTWKQAYLFNVIKSLYIDVVPTKHPNYFRQLSDILISQSFTIGRGGRKSLDLKIRIMFCTQIGKLMVLDVNNSDEVVCTAPE